jgi:hypothetical protein
MSAARQVKAVTTGIAECVTEDHLPIRWNHGTRPAKYWHWRAIRRCNSLPFLSRGQLTTTCSNCWYGTALACLLQRQTAHCDFHCEDYLLRQVLEPFSTTGSTTLIGPGEKPEPFH